jgi:hypothetical protein
MKYSWTRVSSFMNKHFFLNKWMKKLPQTITGRVFGIVFLMAMVFGNSFGHTKKVFADQFDQYRSNFDAGSSISIVNSTGGTLSMPGDTTTFSINLSSGVAPEPSGAYTQAQLDIIDAAYGKVSGGGGTNPTLDPNSFVITLQKAGGPLIVRDITSEIQSRFTSINGKVYGPVLVSNLTEAVYSSNPIIEPNSQYTAGFYYQAHTIAAQAGDADIDGDGDMEYYRIANPVVFTTSTGQTGSSTGNVGTPPPPTSTSGVDGVDDGGLPRCSLGVLPGTEMSISGCLAQLVYYAIFVPTSFLLALSGQFMDFMLGYTLDSASYSMGNFVGQGWKLVRDLTNILFIFILVSIGIGTIVGSGKLGDKKLIGWVIIVALLINFSLFFTKVLIDAGNILGTVFYSAMGVKSNDSGVSDVGSVFAGDEKSISVAIVSKFNPQTMFSNADQYRMKLPSVAGADEIVDTGTPPGWFTVLSLILSVVNIVTAYAFFVVGLVFVGRVVGLWMAMILSPLAFMSLAVPPYMSFLFSKYKFSSWLEQVAKMSFSAPVFLFFLYVILSFLNQGFLEQALNVTSDMTTMEKFLSTIVPFVIITMLILKAKETAVEMSDSIGKKFASWGEGLGSLAVGGALAVGTGGAALAMRGTVGRAASALSNSEVLQNAKGKSGIAGMASRLALRGTDKLSKASFDARNTAAADALKKSPLNIDLKRNTIGNAFLGTDDKNRGVFGSSKDGIQGMEKRREADIVREAEERQLSGSALTRQDNKAKEFKSAMSQAQADFDNQKNSYLSSTDYQSQLNASLQAQSVRANQAKIPFDKDKAEAEFKENYLKTKGMPSLSFNEEEFKRSFEAKNGQRSSLSGSAYNADVVKEFKEQVSKGNYGVGGAIKSTIENVTGKDVNQITIPSSGKAGIFGATAALGGVVAAAPLAGAGMISSAVGGFNEPQRAGALKAIDKKFNNKDLESVTNELKKIDEDIKNYLTEHLTKPPYSMSEDQIKNLSDFDKQSKLNEFRKVKEKELVSVEFDLRELDTKLREEKNPTIIKELKDKWIDLGAKRMTLRDQIDDLKKLFDKRERKQDTKEKLENKINPKDKKDDKGGEKKDDKK